MFSGFRWLFGGFGRGRQGVRWESREVFGDISPNIKAPARDRSWDGTYRPVAAPLAQTVVSEARAD